MLASWQVPWRLAPSLGAYMSRLRGASPYRVDCGATTGLVSVPTPRQAIRRLQPGRAGSVGGLRRISYYRSIAGENSAEKYPRFCSTNSWSTRYRG